jgi:hypothetical protein
VKPCSPSSVATYTPSLLGFLFGQAACTHKDESKKTNINSLTNLFNGDDDISSRQNDGEKNNWNEKERRERRELMEEQEDTTNKTAICVSQARYDGLFLCR